MTFEKKFEKTKDFFLLPFTRKIIELPFVDFFLLSDNEIGSSVPRLPADLANLNETGVLEILKEICSCNYNHKFPLNDDDSLWIKKAKSVYLDEFIIDNAEANDDFKVCGKDALKLEPFLLKMNVKKRHEVPRLASKIMESHVDTIVDIGCGQCYLSSYLAVGSNSSVLAFDGDPVQIKGAQKRISLLNRINRRNGHAVQAMTQNLKLELAFVDKAFLLERFIDFPEDWCMSSLHACGDLSVDMIDAFIKIPSCSCLVNLACCYHKLSPNRFPLSTLLGKEDDIVGIISPRALNIASEVPYRWCDPSYQHSLRDSLRRNYFRALLQALLVEIGHIEKGQYIRLGSFGNKVTPLAFKDFAHEAIARLGINVTDADIEKVEKKFHHQKLCFYYCMALKAILGPAIESLILLDRYFYLKEHGFEPRIVSIFDKLISPRNKALIVNK